jgi:hypothetical protein
MKGIFWAKALYPARVFAVDFINGYLEHLHCLISIIQARILIKFS